MVIKQIFDTVRLVLNKERKGYVKPSQIETAVRTAIYEYFDRQLDIYRQTGIIPSRIRQFIKPVTVNLVNGVGAVPQDFAKEITFRNTCNAEGVFLEPEEYYDRKNSFILEPDNNNPIAMIKDSSIYVSPPDDPSIELDYFRFPTDFVYGVIVDQDGRGTTFNEGSSQDTEFTMGDVSEIVKIALMYVGAGFQNQEALQVSSVQGQ